MLTTRSQAEALVHFEVVPVGPLSRGSVAVVCVVFGSHLATGSPVEIRQADHLFQRRESAIGSGAKNIFEATKVSLRDVVVECGAYPVSGSFKNGLAASASEAKAMIEQRIVRE